MTIRDLIDNNENTSIIVNRPATNDPCEPWIDRVYEGMLHEIPASLQAEKVRDTGWSITADKPVITLYARS